jgi:hypothetical protein
VRVVCVSLCGEALARRGFREKRFHLAVCFFFFCFCFSGEVGLLTHPQLAYL